MCRHSILNNGTGALEEFLAIWNHMDYSIVAVSIKRMLLSRRDVPMSVFSLTITLESSEKKTHYHESFFHTESRFLKIIHTRNSFFSHAVGEN